jgi:hypothetical protein
MVFRPVRSLLVALSAALPALSAMACDCANRYLNVMNGKKDASAIFTGAPTAKEGHYGDVLYVFRVESVWKGTLVKNIYLHGGMDSCAYALRVGTSYLIFAHAGRGTREDPVVTTVCASNKELSAANSEVKRLGKPVEFYPRVDRATAPPWLRRGLVAPPPPPPPPVPMPSATSGYPPEVAPPKAAPR